MIKTEIGYTTSSEITVRGRSLTGDLIGKIDFIDMMMLVAIGRICQDQERNMINAILVTVTDHGLTPSAIAARLTYLGAPESLQGAVAAGLLGAGNRFLGAMQDAFDMLRRISCDLKADTTESALRAAVNVFILDRKTAGQPFAGFGHNIHVDGDPRIPALRAVSESNGYFGLHWQALLMLEKMLQEQRGKLLPINTAGAVGAMLADMKLPSQLARGFTLVGRCAGLVAHLIEEESAPTGKEIWELVLGEDARNVLPGKPLK